ncbi:UDP-glucose 4-epimerase GalE [Candidatus Gracilibacteria bacterium]|nr:MAG: UDP-glucose 4-epimerase GalE [Candidatus Gracilibacteria bacterium]PIE85391.1 MAG: UDP-glucose 4-epimerase GalE [Candidatus Gracilibacteria bacterium]
MKKILLTGATGYIGSHGAVELIEKGYIVTILDNLSNSSIEVIDTIKKITGIKPEFYELDLRDKEGLENIFKENSFDCVIHFAGAKAVGESCDKPFFYYENNIVGSLNLFECMDKYNVKNIIFSSSATVYKSGEKLPFTEETLTGNTTNPYGTTKLIIENILRDLSIHKGFNVISLRYFNPIGAHFSGLIGENPNDIPNNLLPFIMKVLSSELPSLSVFGDDYNTVDGTGERDYIHVSDLIIGHIKALNFIEKNSNNSSKSIFEVINLGTGKPNSVFEVIKVAENVTGKKIKYNIAPRRSGDVATVYCSPTKAKELLDWEAKKTLQDSIEDGWKFKTNMNHNK